MLTQVKICGICRSSDAELAVQLGANYIGLIFVKTSPRYIELEQAKKIVRSLPRGASIVGVFQNSSIEEMENVASLLDLSYFQLHGNETPQVCSSLSKPVIKAFQLSYTLLENPACSTLYNFDLQSDYSGGLKTLQDYRSYCSNFLFDKPKDIHQPNWLEFATRSLAAIEDSLGEYFLAGGLTAGNISTVLQLLHPAVVDVSSGVEEDMRKKSAIMLRKFFKEIKIDSSKKNLVKGIDL